MRTSSVILLQPTAIILDTTPLSLLTQKLGHIDGDACRAWYTLLELNGSRFYVPEIADYELRRELIRAGKTTSLARLDAFIAAEPDRYLALTTPTVRLAADLWAQARNKGVITAPPLALDGDVLIAAQARLFDYSSVGMNTVIVATANVGHLDAVSHAELWSSILPQAS